jgi:NgoBV restriction endonuclease
MSKNNSITAQDFYNLLLKDNIKNSVGKISFSLNNVTVNVKELDAVGHLIQEWILAWAESKGIIIERNPHSQAFPDYFLNGIDSTTGLLEIKSFNYHASPAFDVADFFEYVDYLAEKPYKLYADYLILAYEMCSHTATVTIKDIWLKKIWEIVGYSQKNFITCQIRESNGIRRPYKIRPTSFHKNGKTFKCAKDFLLALQKLLNHNSITQGNYENWFDRINESHFRLYGRYID